LRRRVDAATVAEVPRRIPPRTALRLILPLLIATFMVQSAAAAKPPPDPSDSALAQYVEQIPTSRGSRAVGQGAGEAAGRPLTASAEAELRAQGGADAKLLEAIATSPALGAPARKAKPERRAETTEPETSPSTSEAAGDAGNASTASELISGRVVALLAVLGAVTIGAGLLAASRRRSAE